MAFRTTQQYVENYSNAKVAQVLVIDGTPLAFTTDADLEGIARAFFDGGDPWEQWTYDVRGGLQIIGELSQAIKLNDAKMNPSAVTFRIVDPTGAVEQVLFREQNPGARTHLRVNVLPGDTTVQVLDTTLLPTPPGTAHIAHERFTYTAKSGGVGGTLTGVTRARYAIHSHDDGTAFEPIHYIGGEATIGATTSPAVTERTRTWYRRSVALFLLHWDATRGAWSPMNEARRLWDGWIEVGPQDGRDQEGGVFISFTAVSAAARLQNMLMSEQWRATLATGMYLIDAVEGGVAVFRPGPPATPYAVEVPLNLETTETRYSHGDIAERLNAELAASAGSFVAGDSWSVHLRAMDDGTERYVIRLACEGSVITDPAVVPAIALPKRVARLLGFEEQSLAAGYIDSTGRELRHVVLPRVNNALYERTAGKAPVVVDVFDPAAGAVIGFTGETGAWQNQQSTGDVSPLPLGSEGCVRLGDELWAVEYTGQNTLLLIARLNQKTREWETPAFEGGPTLRLGESGELEVRQVWYEQGAAGTLLLKAALSVGGGLNHTDYDVYTSPGFGAGIPCSLIDVTSWLDLDDVAFELLVDGPTPLYTFLEQVLACSGRYMVWKSSGSATPPKLTVVTPSFESSGAVQAAWTLTQGNKAGTVAEPGSTSFDPDYTEAIRTAEDLVNRIEIHHGGTVDGKNEKRTVITEPSSMADFGRKRTHEIKAHRILNVEAVVNTTIGVALAYFSRPLCYLSRSIDISLVRMAPGDSVFLTDPHVIDPATGLRGVTEQPCWVLEVSYDWKAGRGKVVLVFVPEKDPSRTGLYAPSALVDSTKGTNGYTAATKRLYLEDHEYSDSTEGLDLDAFEVGDAVMVRERDDAAGSIFGPDIIAGKGADYVTLTTGFVGLTAGRRYELEYVDINSLTNDAQLEHAFLADSATRDTGYTTPDPYQYGVDPSAVNLPAAAIDYETPMFEPLATVDDQGEPLSAGTVNLLQRAANNMLQYGTRQECSGWLSTEVSKTGDTNYKLVCTVFVPLYGHVSIGGIRGLRCSARGKCSGASGTPNAEVYFVSSTQPPRGDSYEQPTLEEFFTGPIQSTGNSNPTTTDFWFVSGDDIPLRAQPVAAGNGMWGTYVSFFIRTSDAANTSYMSAWAVAEAKLA